MSALSPSVPIVPGGYTARSISSGAAASRTTWEQVREAWATAEQTGFAAVLQAAKVGQMLIELMASTAHGEFMANYQSADICGRQQLQNLMTLMFVHHNFNGWHQRVCG
jgi:hypothetical protein